MRTGIIILLSAIALLSHAQPPKRPWPPQLVNDLANVFTAEQVSTMETKLVEFSNSTTTQITVVTVNSLDGYDKAEYAFELGEKWGVGDAKFDNGIVVLFKPKTPDASGQIFIATGYGLEGVIPDAIAKRIVENEMIPLFKENKIYEGIDKGLNVLMDLSLGEYTAKEYKRKTQREERIGSTIFGIIFFFIIFLNIIGGARRRQRGTIGRSLPFWVALSMLGSSGRHSGSFGNFSSGGGGFGGFGGGSFGGGGAGGSW